ncbi:MAG TPA: hypothetical protein VKW76_01555 [Candidatus Binatia bacterium]|nr:hypothetical protein [Candidatus Binatia bacterium]
MRALLIAITLGLAGSAAASISLREAPRATDLLTAERAAERTRRLLSLPPHRSGGWRHGGSGFDAPEAPAPPPAPPVRIEIRPSRSPSRP